MRIPILLILLCLTLPSLLHAQEEYQPRPLYIIAPNGLKLREGPGTQYKVLEIAPYKSKVLLMDPNFIQFDSTQRITLPKFAYSGEDYILTGAWLKIRFKNKEGYMLSTWLYPTCEQSYPDPPGMNKQIQMFNQINHFDCFHIPKTSADYWYDLTLDSQGQFSMETTNIEFFVETGEIGYGAIFGLITRRVDNKKAGRILRSVNPLAEGKLMQLPAPSFDQLYQKVQKEALYYSGDYQTQSKLLFKAKNEELKKVHLQMSFDDKTYETKIYSTINGEKKLMYVNKHLGGNGISKVSMVADVDGDGILDYMLGFGDEKSSIEILFLSSEAEPGFSHKAVASINDGYIC